MVPRLSVTTDTAVLSTYHGAAIISPYWYCRAIHTPWCHDCQSLLILPCYLHIMVPRQSVPTDTIVLSTHHGVTAISHYWHYRAIHTSRCHDHQSRLIRSCYLHVMVPRLSVNTDRRVIYIPWCYDDQSLLILSCYPHTMMPRPSVTTGTIVLSTHHDATTISHYYYYDRVIYMSWCHDYQSLPILP